MAQTGNSTASVEFAVNLDNLANSCYDYTNETSFTDAEAACVSAASALPVVYKSWCLSTPISHAENVNCQLVKSVESVKSNK